MDSFNWLEFIDSYHKYFNLLNNSNELDCSYQVSPYITNSHICYTSAMGSFDFSKLDSFVLSQLGSFDISLFGSFVLSRFGSFNISQFGSFDIRRYGSFSFGYFGSFGYGSFGFGSFNKGSNIFYIPNFIADEPLNIFGYGLDLI